MSALIEKKANVDIQAKNGMTALMIASITNNLKIVEHLVDFGNADVNVRYVDSLEHRFGSITAIARLTDPYLPLLTLLTFPTQRPCSVVTKME